MRNLDSECDVSHVNAGQTGKTFVVQCGRLKREYEPALMNEGTSNRFGVHRCSFRADRSVRCCRVMKRYC